MKLKEAKEILNKNGFLLENSVSGLDDSDKLIYLYLSLKNEGYDVSNSTDLVVREKTFKLKIKQQIEIEKLGLTVNVSSIVISEDGCEIMAILGGENHSFVTIHFLPSWNNREIPVFCYDVTPKKYGGASWIREP